MDLRVYNYEAIKGLRNYGVGGVEVNYDTYMNTSNKGVIQKKNIINEYKNLQTEY